MAGQIESERWRKNRAKETQDTTRERERASNDTYWHPGHQALVSGCTSFILSTVDCCSSACGLLCGE